MRRRGQGAADTAVHISEMTNEEMTRMMIRREEMEPFRKLMDSDEVSVVNLYGEAGIGKSSFVKHLIKSDDVKNRMVGGYLDFGHIKTPVEDEMIDSLYDLCDQLKIISNFKPDDFNVADYVDSRRSKRIPYAERSESGTGIDLIDTALDISEIASQFIDLTYLGTGLKAWKMLTNIYQKYKAVSEEEKARYQKYESMDDRTLRNSLPGALATDLNSLKGKGRRKIVMVLDHVDSHEGELGKSDHSWLHKLLERKDSGIKWVVVTRKPLTDPIAGMEKLEIKAIPDTDMRDYLEKQSIRPADIDQIITLSGGSPFYLQRVLALIQEKKSFTEDDWIRLQSRDRLYIAREYVDNLPAELSDILFVLACAEEFDRSLFHILFPEKLFERLLQWFLGSTFEHTGGRYRVQSSMKDIILDYLAELNPNIEQECYDKLFAAECQWVRQYSSEAGADLDHHLRNLCLYAKKRGDIRTSFAALSELKGIMLSTGNATLYSKEVEELLTACEQQDGVQLSILLEAALLAYYWADYQQAAQRCVQGRDLARRNRSAAMELQFLAIQMDIAHIAPSEEKDASQQVIDLATAFLTLLEQQRAAIPYRMYLTNKMNVYLRLARAYTTKSNFPRALAYLQDFFKTLTADKVSALGLHDLYARAHEMMGNLYGQMGKHEDELDMEYRAVDAYNIAEVMQRIWDPEFYLNFGLACKRLGESCLREGKLEEGLTLIDDALAKYQLVHQNAPEMIDTYCKIGFACNDAAQYLLKHENYRKKAEEYLACAENTANEAINFMEKLKGTETVGNRQICSIRCTAARLSGVLLFTQNRHQEAEESFQKALEYGRQFVLAVPTHPYSYLGNARTYVNYAEFLSETCRLQEAGKAAEYGMEALRMARSYSDDANAFQKEFDRLKQLSSLA